MPYSGRNILIADPVKRRRKNLLDKIAPFARSAKLIEAETVDDCQHAFAEGSIDIAFLDMAFCGPDQSPGCYADNDRQDLPLVVVMSDQPATETIECTDCLKPVLYDMIYHPVGTSELDRIKKRWQAQVKQLSVLVVDDKRNLRKVIMKVLGESRFNLRVSEADTSAMAATLCKTIRYDVVFMDYHMPGMSGLDCAARIVKQQPGARVVMTCSSDSQELAAQTKEKGLDGFLKKPFYPKDVDALLHKLLGLKEPNLSQTRFFNSPAPSSKAAAQDHTEIVLL